MKAKGLTIMALDSVTTVYVYVTSYRETEDQDMSATSWRSDVSVNIFTPENGQP